MAENEVANVQQKQTTEQLIAKLKIEREQVKDSLNRFCGFIDRFTEDKIENLELRLRTAEATLLRDFTNIQNNLELLDKNEKKSNERDDFEDRYYCYTAKAVKICRNFYDTKPIPGIPVPNPSLSSQNQTIGLFGGSASGSGSSKGFPTIELIKFYGEYDKWAQFRDLYKNLVHNDPNIDKIKKFYYLIGSLRSEAAKVIEAIDITEQNYDLAWNLLIERYENKALTIKNHVKAILDLPTVFKEKYTLRQLLDDFQKRFRALKQLGEPVDMWSTLLIQILCNKLDFRTVNQWEEFVINKKLNGPTLEQLLNFLSDRCKLFETTDFQFKKDKNNYNTQFPLRDASNKGRQKQAFSLQTGKQLTCLYCKEKHHIYRCEKLIQLPVASRIEEIKKLKLCINCLRSNHTYNECVAQGCRTCNKKHNTLLHENSSYTGGTQKVDAVGVAVNHSAKNGTEVLLSTAKVLIKNRFGNWVSCRALLDSGSQSNFITQELANKLDLKFYNTNIPVTGIGEAVNNVVHSVTTEIKSDDSKYLTKTSFLVLDRITENLPSQTFSKSQLKLPENIKLSDQNFNQSSGIDLLIGVTIFYQILLPNKIELGEHLPIIQNTSFGWVLSGPLSCYGSPRKTQCHFLTAQVSLEDQLQKFWKLEEYPTQKFLTKEEIDCERIFTETLKRDEKDGHFIVSLPIQDNCGVLGESLNAAIQRLKSMERKFKKDEEFKQQYTQFMTEYEQLGHMKKIEPEKINIENNGNNIFYLPHHGVKNESSTTTKLRVVFDGSCHSDTGVSLNDILMTGPTIQDELFAILLRFRKHNIVITADIAKMYRQVKLSPEQYDLQRIVWRKDPDEDIQHYQLTTVTYGTATAPYLAIRALHEAAYENQERYPLASSVILNDFYVDDLITGQEHISDAIKLKEEISQILNMYGFLLRKWVSNSHEVLGQEAIDPTDKYNVQDGEIKRTLGLVWHAQNDVLTYTIKEISTSKITKRSILSAISSIFDPLGLVSPIIIRAKILIQRIWQLKEGWDSVLPSDINISWEKFVKELTLLNQIKINRHALIKNAKYIELHSFCDASESAYGACIYLRSFNDSGECLTRLLCSKSRVAPVKVVTIPRLELCGAVLAVKLCETVQTFLKIKIDKVYYWTDSTIVLSWLAMSPSVLKIFVANRVADIQSKSEISQWRHVSSNENPSDLISRGTSIENLQKSSLWWSGPHWLSVTDESLWPTSINVTSDISTNIPEVKAKKALVSIKTENKLDIFNRFSKLSKLLHVVAYCYRFYKNCKIKQQRNFGQLTVDEINNALKILLKIAQKEMFPAELICAEHSREINKKSKLLSLNPVLDSEGLLRLDGRLAKSNLPYDAKHQIILSGKHPLTKLIILNEHYKNLHAGITSILGILREKYWIIHGRRVVKSTLRSCMICFRINPQRLIQKMAPLPEDRVIQNRPFYVSGVDFAGPFLIKDGKSRNRIVIKAYLCIFICFTTKAVHLEAVGDLSSDTFLDALKRFVSRRGLCKTIYSDNATNFVGACNELKSIMQSIPKFINEPSIRNYLLQNRITWKWIPPRSAHHGGLWENAVKRAKFHLSRIIGKNHFTFEKLTTLFSQVEAALNSAPITPISDDPSDFSYLTPGHFLIGSPLLAIPSQDLKDLPMNRLTQYQEIQQMFQKFWTRWSRDYLSTLQQRSKWRSQVDQTLKIGSLVLVVDENLPPLYWKLGRVIELHPGDDGLLRVVTINTTSGVTRRAVQRLCPLPIESTTDEA